MNTVFCTGNELQVLKRGQADCWILYIASGEADFLDGTDICCASAGDVVIVGLTNLDIQINPSADCSSYVLSIKDFGAYNIVRQHLHLMEITDEAISAIPTGRQQSSIHAVFQNLVAQNGDLALCRESLQELMVRLYRASLKIASGLVGCRMDIVSNLQERLKKDYSQNITLEGLADTYRISISYLSHVFKSATGIPIMRYLLCCRIEAAKEHLAQSDLSVRDITKLCGFNDISNFGRTFKKEVGCSPRQYRKQHRPAKK